MKFTMYFLRIIGIASLLYFIAIILTSGRKTSFLWFWIATTLASFSIAYYLGHLLKQPSNTPRILGNLLTTSIWIGMAIFLIIETIIILVSLKEATPNADYVIILGAQVRGTLPSKTLHARIEAAADYLSKNQTTIAICSGGQGEGEDITEALAIKRGLLARGIDESRILIEDQSTNTIQNLLYSKKLLSSMDSSVVIITSNFHTYRALLIASGQGMQQVTPYAAKEFLITTPQYYVREFFALVKDFFCGNF